MNDRPDAVAKFDASVSIVTSLPACSDKLTAPVFGCGMKPASTSIAMAQPLAFRLPPPLVIEPSDNVSDMAILAPDPPTVTFHPLKLPAAVIPSEEVCEKDAGNAVWAAIAL